MKTKAFSKLISFGVGFILAVSAATVTAYSIDFQESSDGYYKVVSKQDWELAPGITESEIILNTADGTRRQVNHVIEIDIHNPYTKVMPSTYKMAEGLENKEYSTQIMSEQVRYAEEHGYGNVVAATNATLHWYDTDYYKEHPELVGETLGTLIMDGVRYTNSQGQDWGAYNCLVINYDEKDGVVRPANRPKTEVRDINSRLTGWEEQLIPIQFHWLVINGQNIFGPDDPTEPAPRTFFGIKADGTILLVMNEGRMEPFSRGFNCYEMAEFMLSLGCVWAANSDGGGSSTFLSQRPGEDLELNCSLSDGGERPTTHGVLVISTAPAEGEFVTASISSEAEYYTPGSTVYFSAKGYDLDGTPADIPMDATWLLKDESFGTLEGGVFTSNGKTGEVTVQLIADNKVVGEDSILIVTPDTLSFTSQNIVVPFGERIKLSLRATYDGHEVVLKDSDVLFALDDPSIGSIDGFYFAAGSEGVSSAKTSIKATVFSISAMTEVCLGKGSSLIYSFENGNDVDVLNGWGIHPVTGGARGDIRVITRSSGKVKNGDFALAVTCDFTQSSEPEKHTLKVSFPAVDCSGAVRVGFWIYVPYEARFARLNFGDGCNEACIFDCTHNCKLTRLNNEGWHYVTAEVEKVNTVSSICIDMFDEYSEEYSAWNKSNLNGKYTFYIDDITVDYSDAVSDRHAPIFPNYGLRNSHTGWCGYSSSTLYDNNVGFEIPVVDNPYFANASGVDEKSAKVWVNGVSVDCTYDNGKIFVPSVILANGYHTVKFEIADNAGNVASYQSWTPFLVNGNFTASTIEVVPRDPAADGLLIGSLYWIDVVASDIEIVDGVELMLNLNNASSWELEGMTLAEGFSVSYAVQKEDNTASIVITRTGENTAVGRAVLVSFPVRTWLSESDKSPADLVRNRESWAQDVEIRLETGKVTYTDSYVSTTLSAFGMKKVLVNTELSFNGYGLFDEEWQKWLDEYVATSGGFHAHTPYALADKPATCTEAGYIGRTFCDGCSSVVEWGTSISGDSHTYQADTISRKIVCECGRVFTGTGLQTIDGKNYYTVGGTLTGGWITVNNVWYYFDKSTFIGLNGEKYADQGVKFVFDNGRLTDGTWVETSAGKRYWYGPSYYKDSSSETTSCRPYEIDGKTYLFNRYGYMQTGIAKYFNGNYSVYYDCGEDGVAVIYTGPYNSFFYIDGIRQNAYKLIAHNGYYYYVSNGHKLAMNTTVYLNKVLQGTGLPAGNYAFDVEGRMIIESAPPIDPIPPVTPDPPTEPAPPQDEVKNGVINGYLYINGVKQTRYKLVEYAGHFYYVSDGDKVARNTTLYLAKAVEGMTYADGKPMQKGHFTFDAEGRMVITSSVPEGAKHGVIGDFLYLNDVKQLAYQLIAFQGNYFYVSDGHKIARNTKLYLNKALVGKTFADGSVLEKGTYEFDSEGKMVTEKDAPQDGAKHGVVGDYLYLNDVKQLAYKIVSFNGDYYYVSDGHKIARNTKLYLNKVLEGLTFADGTPMQKGHYEFDSAGKMVIQNIVPETPRHGVVDGYLYINNVKQLAYQLIELDGSFYYVSDGHKVARNTKVYLNKALEGKTFADGTPMQKGYYEFDSDGKMVVENAVPEKVKHGVVDGCLYINNVKQLAYQLIEFEGNYYYVSDSHKVARNAKVYLNKALEGKTFADGTPMQKGYYFFDTDGKMIVP